MTASDRIVLQNSKNGLQRFFREKRNQAKIANQYVLKRATEVAGGIITCCCAPPHDYSIAAPKPGKFFFSDPKRVLQHYRSHSGLTADITPCPKSADSVAKVFLSHRSQIFRAVRAAIEY